MKILQDVTLLETHGPFLRSAQGPKVRAIAKCKHDPGWDKWFVHGDAGH